MYIGKSFPLKSQFLQSMYLLDGFEYNGEILWKMRQFARLHIGTKLF